MLHRITACLLWSVLSSKFPDACTDLTVAKELVHSLPTAWSGFSRKVGPPVALIAFPEGVLPWLVCCWLSRVCEMTLESRHDTRHDVVLLWLQALVASSSRHRPVCTPPPLC